MMATCNHLHMPLLLLASYAILAYGVPLTQQGEDFATTVTVATVTVQPTRTAAAWGSEPSNVGIIGYVPSPDRRGTMGILMSCIMTLFLCVWTTVAVNIEPVVELSENPGIIARIDYISTIRSVRKIGWSISSLMVPEITMTIAAYERCTARLLRTEMWKIIEDKNKAEIRTDIGIQTTDGDEKRKDIGVQTTVDDLLQATDGEEKGKCGSDIVPETDVQQEANNSEQKGNVVQRTASAVKKTNEPGKKYEPHPWDCLTLSYYAVMGGFRVIYDHDPEHPHAKGTAAAQEGQQEDARTENEPLHGTMTKESSKLASTDSTCTPTAFRCRNNRESSDSQSCKCQIGLLSSIRGGSKKKCPWYIQDAKTYQSAATLTPHGVLWMARRGWLPFVAPEFVKDKSQANTLAKVLVCFQAGWMILQVCGRASANQSVALLELHTVLRAMCAGTMYITWWDKPIDIDLPTEIFLKKHQFDELVNAKEEPNATNPFSNGKLHSPDPRFKSDGEPDKKYVTSRAGLGKLMYQQLSKEKNVLTNLRSLGEAFDRIIKGRSNIVWEGAFLSTVGLTYGGVHLATWNNHFETLFEEYAWKACSIVTAFAVLGFILQLCIGTLIQHIDFTESTELNDSKTGTQQSEVGGTDVEKNVLSEIITTIHVPPGKSSPGAAKLGVRSNRLCRRIYKLIVGTTFFVGFIIVIFSRLFLFIESFIALRGQSNGVYDTVNWAESLPNIS